MKSINPDPSRLSGIFAGIPSDTPIVMTNLLKFRTRALYPDGASDCSGREAYERYSRVAISKVAEVGGRPFWRGEVKGLVIAPEGEDWDEVLLVRYPSIQAFMTMLAMPDYRKSTVHRTAALEDSRLIASIEQPLA